MYRRIGNSDLFVAQLQSSSWQALFYRLGQPALPVTANLCFLSMPSLPSHWPGVFLSLCYVFCQCQPLFSVTAKPLFSASASLCFLSLPAFVFCHCQPLFSVTASPCFLSMPLQALPHWPVVFFSLC
jgi:hypothetical protein